MSYKLIIGQIEKIEPIIGADRIVAGVIFGKTVVLGKDNNVGDILCYADTDGIFEDKFCEVNNLFPVLDKDGKKIGGGFFTKGRARIRAQTFRGVKSHGFAFPLEYLKYTGYDISALKVGDQFDELNGVKICSKFVNEATLRELGAKNKVKTVKKKITFCFPEHVDSEQFEYKSDCIKIGDLLTISEKIHGTSGRLTYTYLEEFNPILKFLSKFLPFIKTKKLDYLVGTRRTILKASINSTSYYGNEGFRFKFLDLVKDKLHPGEIIYGELAGYDSNGREIMEAHDTKEVKIKEFIKRYGPKIKYTYGCLPGECQFYVYRVARIDENGNSYDLTWAQVKERCAELGLQHVKELLPSFVYDGNIRNLQNLVNDLTDGDSTVDPTIHREGCVVRVDNGGRNPLFLKNKSWAFGVMEGYIKSNDNYVDMEESS